MKFRFPIIIIDEDFRSENTSGLGIRALAQAIESEGFEVLGVTSYGDHDHLGDLAVAQVGGNGACGQANGQHEQVKGTGEQFQGDGATARQPPKG